MSTRGMAIPMVLGFILVATILGSSLIFMSRNTGNDSHRNVGRLQLINITQQGLHEALVIIKPMRITEIIAKKGPSWEFKTSKIQYGRAVAWCEVKVKTLGSSELEIESIGHWQEKSGGIQKKKVSCRARYKETIRESSGRHFSTNVEIEGEWKIEGFVENLDE